MPTLFLGTHSAQSSATLKSLLESSTPPAMVLIHSPIQCRSLGLAITTDQPTLGPAELAAAHNVPAATVAHAQLAEMIENHHPRRVLVSCYPRRIEQALLNAVPDGWYNIHPSLLPAYQGPAPIFWQLRDGAAAIGVTLHKMTEQLDQGPILDHSSFDMPEGADHQLLSRMAGALGARLFLGLNSAQPANDQPTAIASSHFGYPAEQDFVVDPAWETGHAYRFINGVMALGRPAIIDSNGMRRMVTRAISCHSEAPPDSTATPGIINMRLQDGWIRLQIEA